MRLSIILPVYNTGKWLGQCIASIRNQGLDPNDYEIIAVNDGTEDDAMDVLQSFRNEEEKAGVQTAPWVIIEQENQGLSSARNAGLKAAQGTYVWFVDSDDYLVPGVLPNLLAHAESKCLDVLCFGLQLVAENGDIVPFHVPDSSGGKVMRGEEFLLNVDAPPAAWSALYRRGYLQSRHLTFYEGILHEDQDFTPRAYFMARRIAFDPIVAYNYVQREGSIMKSANPKKSTDLLLICRRLWDFAMEHTQIESSIRYLFVNRISFLFSQVLSNLCRCGIREFPVDEKTLPYYPLSINKYLNKKERYKYKLINAGIPLYLSLYSKFVKMNRPAAPAKRLRIRP